MNIRYFFVGDVAARKHITIEYCPTDEMIGDFFTKPLGGSKFRRFRNIIMNITHDEYGDVDMDELMAVHQAKMQRRFELMAHDSDSEDECTISADVSKVSASDGPSQECVGNGSKRSSTMWASVRRAHKHKPTKGYSYARAVTGDVSATPTTE